MNTNKPLNIDYEHIDNYIRDMQQLDIDYNKKLEELQKEQDDLYNVTVGLCLFGIGICLTALILTFFITR